MENKEKDQGPFIVNVELCRGCMKCLKIGCPGIIRMDHKVIIDPGQCRGCGQCVQVCPQGCIYQLEDD